MPVGAQFPVDNRAKRNAKAVEAEHFVFSTMASDLDEVRIAWRFAYSSETHCGWQAIEGSSSR